MSDYFDRVERQIVRRVEAGAPRSSWLPVASGHLATAAAVLVVIAVAGVFLLVRGGGGANPAPASAPGVDVNFSASPAAPTAIVDQAGQILRERLRAAVPGARVSVTDHQITVTHAPAGARSRILTLAAPGVLEFYDWEANVLTPDGKPVAGQLPSPSPAVLAISQGYGGAAPGQLGSGCVPLQQALAIAGGAGAGTPRRTEYIGGLRLRVPVGYTVLEAAPTSPGGVSDGYFVVREHPAMPKRAIVSPRASSDPNTGAPVIQFGFTAIGKREFESVTAAVAHRGALVSSPGETLNQHFAVAVDNRLITVPFIDFKQYPAGITGDNGADLSGAFTPQSAKDLAILLRYGPLPATLTATG